MSDKHTYIINGATGDWEIVIGMEVHAQVKSNAKLFSGAAAAFGAEPNTLVSLVDAGMPGMLPVLNRACVAQAVRTGLGLLEQDAGKSIHDLDPDATYVDLNRSGVALMEIVSRPHVRTPGDAAAYVRTLRTVLRYLDTCDGDMEKGQLRADVNVSVCRPSQYEKFIDTDSLEHLGTRCEIKNVNSLRFIMQAIEYEAQRQVNIIEDGGKINQETRLFDANAGATRSMRSKEDAHDYRYFPDPDLPPLELEQSFIDELKANLPELPAQKRKRFVEKLGLSEYDASVLVADKDRADYFEQVLEGRDPKLAANWVNNELFGRLNKEGLGIAESPVSPDQLGGIVSLIKDGVISGKIAKDVFDIIWNEGGDPAQVVEEHGMKQVTDTGAIEKVIDELITANTEQARKVRQKPKAMGWFVGQVMKAMGGKANPQAVNEILAKKLLD